LKRSVPKTKAKAQALTKIFGAWTRQGARRRPVRSKQDVCDWKANPPWGNILYLQKNEDLKRSAPKTKAKA
jgi:hypothetical protein